jgi:hypothetical protein
MRNGAGDRGVRVDEHPVSFPHMLDARKRLDIICPSRREISDFRTAMLRQLKKTLVLEFAHHGRDEFRIIIECKVQEPFKIA